jgi:hypothetical protein
MPTNLQEFSPIGRLLAVAAATVILAGCAQQRDPGYYAVEQNTTQSDALQQAEGPTGSMAPSQIQLPFGNQKKKPAQKQSDQAKAQAAVREATRPLMQAKTFLGTLPCITKTDTCSANRITLTIAPTGEWRARTEILGPDSKPGGKAVQQGCWSVIGTKPLKVLLQLKNDNSKASLTFINDNVLQVDSFNGVRPTLNYRLTRQADIDAIDELHGLPALHCSSVQVQQLS